MEDSTQPSILATLKSHIFKKSLHYENTSEIPVFNIIKMHGSLCWKFNEEKDKIYLDRGLDCVRTVQSKITKPSFDDEYEKLIVVNPTKEKFRDTLLKQYYYDLLRIYSNELEKENSILFVLGFSFADEHIRDLTERVASANPTLKIYIFAHSATSPIYEKLKTEAKNRNIDILLAENGKVYDLETINSEILDRIIPTTDPVVEIEDFENSEL